MTLWVLTSEEDEALSYLPYRAQVLYIRGLRRHMDMATGIVGETRKVSYQMFKELLEVRPRRGSSQGFSIPTRDMIRASIKQLEQVGLILTISTGNRFENQKYKLLLAYSNKTKKNRLNEEPPLNPHIEPTYYPQKERPDQVNKNILNNSTISSNNPQVNPRNYPQSESVRNPPPQGFKIINTKTKNIYRESGTNKKLTINYPKWLSQNLFEAFLELRSQLKILNTPFIIQTLLEQLETLKNQGHDPSAVIKQSMVNNWKGLFPISQVKNNNAFTHSPGGFCHEQFTNEDYLRGINDDYTF